MTDVKEVISVRRYKAGYEVRTELIDGSPHGCLDFTMKVAYTTPEGHYIGPSRWAYRLCKVRGIKPEPKPLELYPAPDIAEANAGRGPTCCIGFCEAEQRWYGWSHRAIHGFAIGDKVDSPDHLCAHSGWTGEFLEKHPEADLSLPVGFEAKTLEDAKRMAIAFADAVG